MFCIVRRSPTRKQLSSLLNTNTSNTSSKFIHRCTGIPHQTQRVNFNRVRLFHSTSQRSFNFSEEFQKLRYSKQLREVGSIFVAGAVLYFLYNRVMVVDTSFNSPAPNDVQKSIEIAKYQVAQGNFIHAVHQYETVASVLQSRRLDYTHTSFHVQSALFSLYEELNEVVGSNRCFNKALDINARLLSTMNSHAKAGERLVNGLPASSNSMVLRIERAVLLDYAAQRSRDQDRIEDAEKLYKQALTLLTSQEKGIDEMNPPQISEQAQILWVNSLCGVLNNFGDFYKQEGKLEESFSLLNASANLSSRFCLDGSMTAEGNIVVLDAVSVDDMNHSMALRDEVLSLIQIRNEIDTVDSSMISGDQSSNSEPGDNSVDV